MQAVFCFFLGTSCPQYRQLMSPNYPGFFYVRIPRVLIGTIAIELSSHNCFTPHRFVSFLLSYRVTNTIAYNLPERKRKPENSQCVRKISYVPRVSAREYQQSPRPNNHTPSADNNPHRHNRFRVQSSHNNFP